jgi:hypothetical protein
MKPVIGAIVAAGAVVLVVSACGTASVPPGGAGAAPAGTAASTSASSAATPQQRADADAASILASFAVPPGAVRLPAAPATAGWLAHPPAVFPTADVVDDVSWWRVPGKPQTVLDWEAAHTPSRFAAAGRTSVGSPPEVRADQFTLPPVAGVLSARDLGVQAVSVSGGQTALRVDAEVTWIPARPASERVPAAASAVTVSVQRGMVADVKIPPSVTITDPAKVRELAAATDALPLWSGEHVMCPADFGESVRLTFTKGPGGPALAVAVASVSGCGLTNFTVNGKPELPLAGGAALAREALAVTGLHVVPVRGPGPVPVGRVNPGGPMMP